MQVLAAKLQKLGFLKAGGRSVPLLVLSAVLLACCSPALAAEAPAKGTEVVQRSVSGSVLEVVLFYFFAIATVASALAICISRNIVRMAVYLFFTLGAVAVLYFLLLANFIAVIQLIVYVGGTLVLLIFGVMLTSKSPWARFDTRPGEMLIAGAVCVILALALIGLLSGTHWPGGGQAEAASVAFLGKELLTTYLVPFEAVSVLLLVVMVGAAYLARQER